MRNNLQKSFSMKDNGIQLNCMGTSHDGYVHVYIENHVNPFITKPLGNLL